MSVESAADRATFTDAADFGEAVSWTVAGGSPVVVVALTEGGERAADPYGESMVQVAAARLMFRIEDLPVGAAQGDAVVKNSVSFRVRAIYADGTGMVEVELEKVAN